MDGTGGCSWASSPARMWDDRLSPGSFHRSGPGVVQVAFPPLPRRNRMEDGARGLHRALSESLVTARDRTSTNINDPPGVLGRRGGSFSIARVLLAFAMLGIALALAIGSGLWGWRAFVRARPTLAHQPFSDQGFFRAAGPSLWQWTEADRFAWTFVQAIDFENSYPPGVAQSADTSEGLWRARGYSPRSPSVWREAMGIARLSEYVDASLSRRLPYSRVDVLVVGWPWRAFRCIAFEHAAGSVYAGVHVVTGTDLDGGDERPWFAMAPGRSGTGGDGVGMSIAPTEILLWPLVANVGFWLGLLVGGLYGPGRLRQLRARWRERRGLCGKCGYDVRGGDASGVCPECGHSPAPQGRAGAR